MKPPLVARPTRATMPAAVATGSLRTSARTSVIVHVLGSSPAGIGRGVAERWCPWPDANQHTLRYLILSQARLPIPPQGHLSPRRAELESPPPALRGRDNSDARPPVTGQFRNVRQGSCSGDMALSGRPRHHPPAR